MGWSLKNKVITLTGWNKSERNNNLGSNYQEVKRIKLKGR